MGRLSKEDIVTMRQIIGTKIEDELDQLRSFNEERERILESEDRFLSVEALDRVIAIMRNNVSIYEGLLSRLDGGDLG